jgi:hypothetical protein
VLRIAIQITHSTNTSFLVVIPCPLVPWSGRIKIRASPMTLSTTTVRIYAAK